MKDKIIKSKNICLIWSEFKKKRYLRFPRLTLMLPTGKNSTKMQLAGNVRNQHKLKPKIITGITGGGSTVEILNSSG